MLITTVVDETFEGAKIYESSCRTADSHEFQNIKLNLAEIEYDYAFAKEADREIGLEDCIIKNGQFFGVLCECFDDTFTKRAFRISRKALLKYQLVFFLFCALCKVVICVLT